MPEKIKSLKDMRKEQEKKGTAQFPGWEALEKENRQDNPAVLLVIKDDKGNVVNTVNGSNQKGFNRISWNLRHSGKGIERLQSPRGGRGSGGDGPMVTPGNYTVTLMKRVDGETTVLQEPKSFSVVPLYEGTPPRKSYDEMNDFREAANAFQQDLTATNMELSRSLQKVDAMARALNKATMPTNDLYKRLLNAKNTLLDIDKELNGDKLKGEIGERSNPNASDGGSIGWYAFGSTYGPTDEHKGLLVRVQNQLKQVKAKLTPLVNTTLPELEKAIMKTGAPRIEGQGMIKN
jgi:hypothetical protein